MNKRERNATLFLCNKQNKQKYGLRMEMVKSVLPLAFDHSNLCMRERVLKPFSPVLILCTHIRIIKKGKHQPNLFYREARLFSLSIFSALLGQKSLSLTFAFIFEHFFVISLSFSLSFASSFVSKFNY